MSVVTTCATHAAFMLVVHKTPWDSPQTSVVVVGSFPGTFIDKCQQTQ